MFRMRTLLTVVLAAATIAAAGRVLVLADTTPVPLSDAAFFDDTQVQRIDLQMNSRDWDSLIVNYLDNTYYPADLKWNGQTVRNVGIRSRGTGSRSGVKPGLRVDMNRYSTNQVFLNRVKAFILRNQTQDASNMHERISMLLYTKLGVKTLREAFTTLFVDGVYMGVYTIVENPDKALADRAFGDTDGNMYKYDYNADDKPWYFTDMGDDPGAYVPHPFKPETNELDPHPEVIRDWVRSVNNDSDAAFPINITRWLDWDNFVKHIAVENFIADQDGFNGDYGVNNFYLYRRSTDGGTHLTLIPWDKSEAFKNSPDLGIFHNFLDGDPAKRNRLSSRAMTVDVARNGYLDALLQIAKLVKETDPDNPSDTRGWMEREVEREYAQIKTLVYQDTKKPFSNDDFEAAVESLRSFARSRPANVEAQVAAFRK
jgi:spore coat protein CotH